MTIAMLVTGERDWTDEAIVWKTLDRVMAKMRDEFVLIIGDCPTGVDLFAKNYVDFHGMKFHRLETVGPWPAAGPNRNRAMIDKALELRAARTQCLAFWSGRGRKRGETSCTLDCFGRAAEAGIPIRVVPPRERPQGPLVRE